jgi:hypothetical protein
MKKLTLNSEQMGKLTEEEIKLLVSLGIELAEKKYTKDARVSREYDLVITRNCHLCGSSDLKMYHMRINKELNGLEAIPTDVVDDKYKTLNYFVSCCAKCKEYLMHRPLEHTVDLLIATLSKEYFLRNV